MSECLHNIHDAIKTGEIQHLAAVFSRDRESIDERCQRGHCPLYTAALYRNHAAVDFLLDNGAELDIFACAFLGRANDASRLLDEDQSRANAMDLSGTTPLHYAARAGFSPIARMLIDAGADVDARTRSGSTAIMEACHCGPWKSEPANEIVEQLIQGGANVDLHGAAAMGRTDLLELQLARNPSSIDDLNERSETAVFLAAKNNHFDAVRMLVERGADISLADAVGTAALHRTSQECDDELVQYLINNGANAHLCCYVACGDVQGTKQALSERPESWREVFYEFNAVGYAIHSWQLGTLRELLAHGCTLSADDEQHILRISGDESLLRELQQIAKG